MTTTSQRRRWLLTRRLRRLLRPAPVRILVVNTDSATAGPRHVTRAWRQTLTWAREHDVDVVAGVEASDVRVDDTAGDGWQVTQRGDLGSAESALAIATRLPHTRADRIRLHPGIGPTSEGGGIRRRPVLKARITTAPDRRRRWRFPLRLGHAHPSRASRARAAFMRLFAAFGRGVKVGDTNLQPDAAGSYLGGRIHAAGVITASVPVWIPSEAEIVPAAQLGDTDHPGLLVTLWPTVPHTRKEHP